jgi:hypothetical protein
MRRPGGTAPDGPAPQGPPVHLDIRQITLDGYSPGRRDHFARAIQSRLASRGAPQAAARQAAEAILDSVDARLGGTRG